MKKVGIACFTEPGRALAQRIAEGLLPEYETIWYEKGLKAWCADCFAQAELLIFIGACGIAVRTIAPFLKSKTEDPAVLVLDEAGQYVISLLSGHIGGANDYAQRVGAIVGAIPVITTASDVRGKIAVDVFAKKNHLAISSMKAAKYVEAAILRGKPVGLWCTGAVYGTVPPELMEMRAGDWIKKQIDLNTCNGNRLEVQEKRGSYRPDEGPGDRSDHEMQAKQGSYRLDTLSRDRNDHGMQPAEAGKTVFCRTGCDRNSNGVQPYYGKDAPDYGIWISERSCPWQGCAENRTDMAADVTEQTPGTEQSSEQGNPPTTLVLTPNVVTVGIGCRRGKPAAAILEALRRVLAEERIPVEALVGIASIDLKKDEIGLIETAQQLGLPFITYSSEALLAVEGDFTPSEFVKKTTGVDNVCERSALLLAGEDGKLIRRKEAADGVTVALAVQKWGIQF